ncbi:MAG: methyltransferase domain-containing protein [Nocardiopsaceae bacterium]|nr:methyltransferase domain-containing protein [Nocardiopsaceae bacterium]
MTSAGRPTQQPRRPNDPARPYVPTQVAPEPAAPRDWDATDELGYFYAQPRPESVNPFFADALSDYVIRAATGRTTTGRGTTDPVAVLQAGCLAPLRELGIGGLTDRGFRVSVTVADEDTPLTRQVLDATSESYDDVITGDLRTIAVAQRSFDIVYCAGLLERVQHVELVLDHLTGALKPGGLLLLRMGDRRAASALLDRMLPDLARRRLWRGLHPGLPGPFPAVYEKPVCQDGISSYSLMRGLVVAQHSAEPTLKANPAQLSSTVRTACSVISRLTRGRYSGDHDELLYVIRKPQDRFARVV